MTMTEPTVYFNPSDGDARTVPLNDVASLVGRPFADEWWTVDAARAEEFERSTYLESFTSLRAGRRRIMRSRATVGRCL